jgi:hypothetical protein
MQPPRALMDGDAPLPPPKPPDPFSNLREQREKKKTGFDYDPFSTNKSLID